MARMVKVLTAFGLTLACSATYSPADGLKELNVVEQALHQMETAKMSPDQKKLSMKAVSNVEATVAALKSDTKMTKEQRMAKVKDAIQELQGVQSQWELCAAEAAMEKVEKLPSLSQKQREAVKKVVVDVESTVSAIEAGKLTGAAQHEKVGAAIKELTSLQRDWLNATTVSRVEELEHEMASKKAQLKKAEVELKLMKLQKELAEKKLLLKKLTAQKDQAASLEKDRKEDAAEQAMVAKLLATAKALAGRKAAEKKEAAASSAKAAPAADAKKALPVGANSPIAGILTDLKARAQKLSDGIARMDAEEKKKEAQIEETIKAAAAGPAAGQTAATKKGQAMLKMLEKQAHRKYLKARAAKEGERKELEEGVHSVETGDVAALTKLLGKMQRETKSAEAHAKSFLY